MRKKLSFKTRTINQDLIEEKWYVIDAKGQRAGQVATRVAELLLGKDNPLMRDYLTPKNKVIVVNAELIDATESRRTDKLYTNYSGYPGGLKKWTLDEILVRKPKKAVEHAIKGMLPKGRRGRAIYAENLFVYAQGEHKHQAQKPQEIEVKSLKF